MIQMLVITDTSEYCHDASVKIWHLFKIQRCYGNKNGGQSRLKIEKLPFWTKFKALEDQLLKSYITTQLNTKILFHMLCAVIIIVIC